jgi:heptaprenyl diphosphate synthase
MRSSTDTTTKTMLVLALLAALAVLLRLGENLLPLPVQLGAIRPGSILLLFYVYICSVCA